MVRSLRHFILLAFLGACAFSVKSQTWQKYAKSGNAGLGDVVFTSKSTGFMLGGNKVLRTTDTGKTWTQILSGYSQFSRIWFSDPNNGYIIGYNDLVLKTTDGGANWSLKRTGNSDDDLITIYAKDKDTLFVLGPDDLDTYKYGNYLEYSYNGGNSWSRKSTGSTQTIRSMHMWNKNRGIMGSLTGGLFESTDGFSSYNVNWNVNNIIDTRVIKDSVVVIVGLGGKIYRSSDYGKNYKSISSPTTENLMGLHFANDSIGMACGEKGIILYTNNGGLSWTKMVTNTKLTIWKVFVFNKYYAWAAAYSTSGDSLDILKFGSANYVESKINTVRGQVVADVVKNCKYDSKETGPSGILIQATPGPYYTYTLAGGNYELVIPDTGKFTVSSILPYKFGGDKNLCDTLKSHSVSFKTFENKVLNRNFYFLSDSAVRLEVDISSARKRRCGVNLNTITYKNIGFKKVDSTLIQLYYSPYVGIVKADQKYKSADGVITFRTGPLLPGQGGVIHVYDSVFCNDTRVRGLTACMRVLITPKVFVEKKGWDSSWVRSRIDCFEDSLAIIKFYNDSKKPMKDSAVADIFLDELKVASPKYKLAGLDSIKYVIDPRGKLVYLETALKSQHPYLENLRVFKERCGDSAGFFSRQQVIRHVLQEYPSFEDEVCLEIRDSYDPNDITVIPQGAGANHYIKETTKLRYIVRFQNTGTDTAYNITVLDTLPDETDLSGLEMLGGSHTFKYSLLNRNKRNLLKVDFPKVMLVDSFTNEKGSHGFFTYEIRLKTGLPKGRRITNQADIYFDYNDPVRTNSVFNTIYDTVFTKYNPSLVKNCMSRFISIPRDTVVCNKFYYETPYKTVGLNKPRWSVNDVLTRLDQKNDTVAAIVGQHEGKFLFFFELNSCENVWYDTSTVYFWRNPTISVQDSIHCGSVQDNISFSCFSCSYLWSTGSNSYNLVVTQPGTYWVRATNLCKSISDTFRLSYLPYLKLDLGRDTLLCNNEVLRLDPGLSPGTYLWNDGDDKPQKTLNKEGLYSVNFRNRCNNLSDSIRIRYKQTPAVSLGADSIHCDQVNHKLDLDSLNGKYTLTWWDGSPGLKRSINAPGTYSVTAGNECGSRSDTLQLRVVATPTFDLGRDTLYCNSLLHTIRLASHPDYEINWSDGSTGWDKTFTGPGIYWARASNRCGSEEDTITLSRAYTPVVDLGKDTTYCDNFTRTLNAYTTGAKYIWNSGDTSSKVTLTKEGLYWVKASTPCGVKSDTIRLIREYRPVVDLGRDTALRKPFSLRLDAGNSNAAFLWNNGSVTRTIQATAEGTYWVRAVNICGTASDTMIIREIKDTAVDDRVRIYPNPVNDGVLHIVFAAGDIQAEVLDQTGRLVFGPLTGVKKLDINLSEAAMGLYYLRVTTGEKTAIYRILKN